jgi:hypothetical protein
MNELTQRIQDMLTDTGAQFKHRRKWSFTLEAGRGETYANNRPTLYGHNVYPRGSVLAGRDQRVFVEQWDDWDEARAALAEVKKAVKGFKYEDSGSTHVPIDVITNHLPDDTDY